MSPVVIRRPARPKEEAAVVVTEPEPDETPAERRAALLRTLGRKTTWDERGLRGEVMREFKQLGEVPGDGVTTARPWERRIL